MSYVWKSRKFFALSSLIFGYLFTTNFYCLSPLNASITSISNYKISDSNKLKQESSTGNEKNTVENSEFRFNLQTCQKHRQSLVLKCNLLITNLSSRDVNINLSGELFLEKSPRIIDSLGNEYIAKIVQVGRTQSDSLLSTRLAANVPMKIVITFEITQDLSQISLFEIPYNTDSVYGFFDKKIEFRNVDITTSVSNTPA